MKQNPNASRNETSCHFELAEKSQNKSLRFRPLDYARGDKSKFRRAAARLRQDHVPPGGGTEWRRLRQQGRASAHRAVRGSTARARMLTPVVAICTTLCRLGGALGTPVARLHTRLRRLGGTWVFVISLSRGRSPNATSVASTRAKRAEKSQLLFSFPRSGGSVRPQSDSERFDDRGFENGDHPRRLTATPPPLRRGLT